MYIPDINLKIDIDKEVDVFVAFLHHEKFVQNRESILLCYPELKLKLEEINADEKEIVRSFVENEYSKHDTIIKSIVSAAEIKINKYGKTILEHLSELMDYTWSEKHTGYLVVPTILPFSPFNGNTIYFSMVRKIRDSNNKDDVNHEILPLLAHEISHLILGDILQQEKENKLGSYGWTTKHFLQEILAPILMNQKILKDIIGVENYLGNPYLRHLNVEKNFVSENIVVHFKNMYEIMKFSEKIPFVKIVKSMADELESVSTSLDEKFKMWNTNGKNILSDPLLLQKYQEPILIK